MGFFKNQEVAMAMRLIAWQCEKKQIPVPEKASLRRQAELVVDEAHSIARSRGRNVLGIMKELIADIRKDKSG